MENINEMGTEHGPCNVSFSEETLYESMSESINTSKTCSTHDSSYTQESVEVSSDKRASNESSTTTDLNSTNTDDDDDKESDQSEEEEGEDTLSEKANTSGDSHVEAAEESSEESNMGDEGHTLPEATESNSSSTISAEEGAEAPSSPTPENLELESQTREGQAVEGEALGDSSQSMRNFLGLFVEDVSCFRCSKYFGDQCLPMILPCGHNICDSCLHNNKPELCIHCGKDLSKYSIEKIFKNCGLIDLIRNFEKRQERHDASLAKVFEKKEDAEYHKTVNQVKNLKDDYFLSPVINLQKDIETKFSSITSFLDIFEDYKSNLESLREENCEFLKRFSLLRSNLLQSKDILDYEKNIRNLSEVLEANKGIFQEHKLFTIEKATRLKEKLNNFIKTNEASLELKRGREGDLMPDDSINYYYYKNLERGTRLHAEITLEDNNLHISSFKSLFPYGLTLFLDFESIERDFCNREKKLFLDIVHKDDSQGMNPNRIYITPEKDENSTKFQDYFSGREGETFCGADIKITQDYISIKHILTEEHTLVNKSVFVDTDTKIDVTAGAIIISVSDEEDMFKICRKPVKKCKCIHVGQITSGIRELKKIKGDCYVQNCGVYLQKALDILSERS